MQFDCSRQEGAARSNFLFRNRTGAFRRACASALAGAVFALFPATIMLPAAPAAAATVHPYAAHVAEAAQRFGIPEQWIWAVMRVESNGNPAAISRAGAMGLMQIMPGTWAGLTARHGLGDNPWNVRANILGGTAYLREMMARYGDPATAFAAYNAGPGRVDDWQRRGRPLPAETVAYVAKLAPVLGKARGASSAAAPVLALVPVVPSWRDAALFVKRGERTSDGRDRTADSATIVLPNGKANAPSVPVSPPPSRTPLPAETGSHGLFIELTGTSER